MIHIQPFHSRNFDGDNRNGLIVARDPHTLRAERSQHAEKCPSTLWEEPFECPSLNCLTETDLALIAAGAAIWLDDGGQGWWLGS